MTNDQLEGVLKAGDILRVRGLWRSNSSSSSSSSSSSATGGNVNKKDALQTNSQKIDRDKHQSTSLTSGQVPKIKLIQPANDKAANDNNLPSQVICIWKRS